MACGVCRDATVTGTCSPCPDGFTTLQPGAAQSGDCLAVPPGEGLQAGSPQYAKRLVSLVSAACQ
jgi:hypothetical protein